MGRRDSLTKGLATAGTVLIWLPILLPFVLSFGPLIRAGVLRFDYLAPAEVAPVALVGAILLGWAAHRARSRQHIIGWGVAIAVVSLIASQALAVITGLASGETEPAGIRWTFVVGLYALYPLALVLIGVAGVMLLRDLFSVPRSSSPGG
jgi:hypothetical protein